jgi:E3 ubiquitin-protein ligase makorin
MASSKDEDIFYYGAPGQNLPSSSTAPQTTTFSSICVEQESDHSISQIQTAWTRQTESTIPECKLYPLGKCRFGLACRYRHIDSSSNNSISSFDDFKERVKERMESFGSTCNVCFENPLCQRKRFGMLTSCNHVFCLSCIREWRQQQDAEFCKACPICRSTSHFVVPTDRHVSDPDRKHLIVSAYKENMSQIPCTHYNFGNGTCPFGSSCFYLHINVDGKIMDKSRLKVDQDGTMSVLDDTISLGTFIHNNKKKKKKKKRK